MAAEGLCRTFVQAGHEVRAVRDVSLTLEPGEVVCLLGRSGSGKSTLLHLLGLLDRPDRGRVTLCGQDTGALGERARAALRLRHVGFVFQASHLVEHLTARENVALPLRYAGIASAERLQRADAVLERVGLSERRPFYPRQLSGGEQQRVALARALVTVGDAPRVILADEPTGELDSRTAEDVAGLFVAAAREAGCAVLIVTHDETLTRIAARVLRMDDGRVATGL
ncbi:MAG: ABC transporter ATP-binding protein [Armatimonadetes bacterium]|nr:ABC transporter ATP-binding protein [Armatimonadota bacterium]